MSYLLVPGRLPGVLVLLGILLLPAGIVQDEEPPEWWRTQRDLTTLLIEGEARIDALVGEATGSSPEGAREAMFRVAVFLRAGMDAEAIAALPRSIRSTTTRPGRSRRGPSPGSSSRCSRPT